MGCSRRQSLKEESSLINEHLMLRARGARGVRENRMYEQSQIQPAMTGLAVLGQTVAVVRAPAPTASEADESQCAFRGC